MNSPHPSQLTPNTIYQADLSHRGIYLGHWKFGLHTGRLRLCPSARKILGMGLIREAGFLRAFGMLSYSDKRALVKAYKFAVFTGSNLNLELKLLTENGNVRWIQIIGTLTYHRWNIADQFVGTIEDITQRRFEDNLNMSLIRHEIRNPLSIIKVNAELVIKLMEPALDRQKVLLLSQIDEHINGITSVLDEHITVMVKGINQIDQKLCEFDLHHVLGKLIGEIQILYRHNKFERLYKGEMWVSADKNRILRVLINYLTNAVKFSKPASIIKIGSAVRGEFAEICIADQGVGVPIGWEEKIFEKYLICPDRSGRQQNSKGLGLYSVKSIIDEHGGKVRAERVKSGGTAFYFSLPLLQEVNKKGIRK